MYAIQGSWWGWRRQAVVHGDREVASSLHHCVFDEGHSVEMYVLHARDLNLRPGCEFVSRGATTNYSG